MQKIRTFLPPALCPHCCLETYQPGLKVDGCKSCRPWTYEAEKKAMAHASDPDLLEAPEGWKTSAALSAEHKISHQSFLLCYHRMSAVGARLPGVKRIKGRIFFSPETVEILLHRIRNPLRKGREAVRLRNGTPHDKIKRPDGWLSYRQAEALIGVQEKDVSDRANRAIKKGQISESEKISIEGIVFISPKMIKLLKKIQRKKVEPRIAPKEFEARLK